MPEWLLKKDNYIPQRKKDAFINKSILSLLNILTRFRLQTEYKSSKLSINAFFKILFTILLITFVSLSRKFTFLVIADVYLLFIVSLLKVDEIKYISKMGIVVSMMTVILLIPSILMGNKNNSFMIVIKVLSSVTAVNIMACTTNWYDTISALRLFRIPNIFLFVFDITLKYIVILGDFSLNMLYALKLRSVGTSSNKTTSLSGIIGTMFLKSREMAEEMYGAMECRCFTGEYKNSKKFIISVSDIIFITINIVIIYSYFYFDRL